MAQHAHETDYDAEHPLTSHEGNEIDVLAIAKFLGWLLLGGVIIFVVLGLLWNVLSGDQARNLPGPFAGPGEVTPGPRLQVSPQTDLQRYLTTQKERLENYGWVDQASGTVHIPVKDAMEKVLQQGLPVRQQTPAAETLRTAPVKQRVSREKTANEPAAN